LKLLAKAADAALEELAGELLAARQAFDARKIS
jgi:hypothetical protein